MSYAVELRRKIGSVLNDQIKPKSRCKTVELRLKA